VQVRSQASTFYDSVPLMADTLQDLFSSRRDTSKLAVYYEEAICTQIDEHERSQGLLGACLIEPIMQGAGGMLFVDPLFQKTLVKVYISFGMALHTEGC
jgi:bifunctional dethiobiotin synthetase / adenosylmethionine---8-amino-7-oxononanoate aminotransferase